MSDSYFAVIDRAEPVSGAVYGIGHTVMEATKDANKGKNGRVVSCSAGAYAHVEQHGGAPSPLLTVTSGGVRLGTEQESVLGAQAPTVNAQGWRAKLARLWSRSRRRSDAQVASHRMA